MSRIDPLLLAQLRGWEGRCETLHDAITAAPANGLSATLDRADGAPAPGDELPPLWHWLYFLPQAPQHALGEDGHPRRGGFLPPVPLPRRMWAGGRLQWMQPMRIGDEVRKTSQILSVTHKAGRSGDLVFTTVRHDFTAGEAGEGMPVNLREEQDIVYRAMPRPGDPSLPAQKAPGDAAWSREIVPDPVLLFRYSALTFNGHRIHYDRRYAVEQESYPALVVHGPLIATLLADLVRRECPRQRFAAFSFRAVRPLFDLHPFHVCGRPAADGKSAQLWAKDHEGLLAMQAEVKFQ
ncbi:MaoC family dehydratase N-terminal domain-containing protein [Variovorax defluvii]|uniref:MaoC family dehydratase N-terminal domain-containing protein n=1 Tax=Variovorax defluvii TaxID=913761 RepID=A0ABP8I8F3_9BURK